MATYARIESTSAGAASFPSVPCENVATDQWTLTVYPYRIHLRDIYHIYLPKGTGERRSCELGAMILAMCNARSTTTDRRKRHKGTDGTSWTRSTILHANDALYTEEIIRIHYSRFKVASRHNMDQETNSVGVWSACARWPYTMVWCMCYVCMYVCVCEVSQREGLRPWTNEYRENEQSRTIVKCRWRHERDKPTVRFI